MTFSTFSYRFSLACLYMAKRYWMITRDSIKSILLKLQASSILIGLNKPIFIEELTVVGYNGSHVADERSGHSLLELQNRRLSVNGVSRDAVIENRYYIKFGDRKIMVSAPQFYKLIPKR